MPAGAIGPTFWPGLPDKGDVRVGGLVVVKQARGDLTDVAKKIGISRNCVGAPTDKRYLRMARRYEG